MKLDGKDYSETSPTIEAGSVTSSGHRVDANTIEMINKRKGKVVEKEDYRVSPDAKTLTVTSHPVGEKTAAAFVYDRI